MGLVWLESKDIIVMGDFSTELSKASIPWTDISFLNSLNLGHTFIKNIH